MKVLKMLGARFFPAPWKYEPATVREQSGWLITNNYFKLYTLDEHFARDYVAKHNVNEGWPLSPTDSETQSALAEAGGLSAR